MAETWRVEVRDGLHRGAVAELAPGTLLLLGADAGCDVVLADAGVAPRHFSLLAHERPQAALPPPPEGDEQSGRATFAHERPQAGRAGRRPRGYEQSGGATFAHEQSLELRVFDAAVVVTQDGAPAELPPGARQALRADAVIELPASAVRLVLHCTRAARPSPAATGEADAVMSSAAAALLPPLRTRRWLFHGVAAGAVFVLIAGALAAVVMRATAGPTLSKETLQALIAQQGLQTSVRIVDDVVGPVLRGVVSAAALNTLQQQLAQRHWQVALQLQTPEQLLAAAENVFRTNGVTAAWTYLGAGRLQVAQVDPADPQVRKLADVVKRDVAGLTELRFAEFEGARPSARASVTEPGKRLTAIVSGATPYVATADNSRYLVGSTLPDGHVVRAIGDQGVQLERDGTTTWLRLD